MNIGETNKAIKVERVGGPKQAPVTTPSPAPELVPTTAKKDAVLATA